MPDPDPPDPYSEEHLRAGVVVVENLMLAGADKPSVGNVAADYDCGWGTHCALGGEVMGRYYIWDILPKRKAKVILPQLQHHVDGGDATARSNAQG